MYDLIGLLLIAIFAPIIIINGKKHYNVGVDKSLKVLTYILLGFELFRFFYTAQFYNRAYLPADKVTFTFLTFSVVVALFATFNKSKFGEVCKTLLVFTALAPTIIALFYPHVYTNDLDTYAVTKALYFAENGILITMAVLLIKDEISKVNKNSLLYSLGFTFVYIFANIMRNIYWFPNMQINLIWYLCMGFIVLSVCLSFIVYFLIKKNE